MGAPFSGPKRSNLRRGGPPVNHNQPRALWLCGDAACPQVKPFFAKSVYDVKVSAAAAATGAGLGAAGAARRSIDIPDSGQRTGRAPAPGEKSIALRSLSRALSPILRFPALVDRRAAKSSGGVFAENARREIKMRPGGGAPRRLTNGEAGEK